MTSTAANPTKAIATENGIVIETERLRLRALRGADLRDQCRLSWTPKPPQSPWGQAQNEQFPNPPQNRPCLAPDQPRRGNPNYEMNCIRFSRKRLALTVLQ